MKPVLRLSKADEHGNGTLGMGLLLQQLKNSGLFEVELHEEPRLNAMRGERATTLYYNDKKIYLDFWEYGSPSHTMNVYNANFDLIVGLQHPNKEFKTFNDYYNRKQMFKELSDDERKAFLGKMVPWTFFPSRLMVPHVGKEESIGRSRVERDCFFCGKNWNCRRGMLESLEKQGIECTYSDQGFKGGRPFTDEKYLDKMVGSKYGLVLRGRNMRLTDCKNRREIDYMMLKKPLLIDYAPNYYEPLVHGEHYILIDQKTQIDSLEDMYNMKEIANNGYEWYKRNATPQGAAETFLRIMEEKL